MIRLICKKFLRRRVAGSLPLSHGCVFSTSSLKPTSETSNSADPRSLTVQYLENSCGMSLESAILASKKLHIATTDAPDSVLRLLKAHGLSQTFIRKFIVTRPSILMADPEKTLKPNIELFASMGVSGTNLAKIISKYPRILQTDAPAVVGFFRAHGFTEKQMSVLTMKLPDLYACNAHKVFKPKLEYFKSLGFSDAEIAKILSMEPYILERSLENQIVPNVQLLKRIVGSDDNVLKVIKACYFLIEFDLGTMMEPNIAVLRGCGVPESKVLKLIMIRPNTFVIKTHRFKEIVEEVLKLGFDPANYLFILAIRSLALMSKSLWEQKLEAYGSFGLTKDEIIFAFKLQPIFMINSEKRIRKLMDFFVNVLYLEPSRISRNPHLMLFSLEGRLIPRCSVLQLLMSKKLITVVQAHQGKIEFKGFPSDLVRLSKLS
ncbi:uncharacterized protein LOC131159465 [Malania oleifera]|uniref:uncharacterized protein LOC131159465 n=1 Tax=Malania oleifera TaxID=397392 RepID=UPI0025ADD996|nr:uncharacterized protein LOC131159465 [Malania oleifera]